MPPASPPSNIAFIGFGEAAQAFCRGWGTARTTSVRAYDIKIDQPDSRQQYLADCTGANVMACENIKDCLTGATVVFSLVTADQALAAGQSAQSALAKNCLYLDCNSCAPDTKRATAAIIGRAGGRYVDVAVMAPVHPTLHQTPMLVSGASADDALKILTHLDMRATKLPGDIGATSTVKMLRSVMVKGLEALIAECVLASRRAGLNDIVLASLEESDPEFGWQKRAQYALDRMVHHGARRAAEMQEVALTIQQLGLSSQMSQATADWQAMIADLDLKTASGTYDQRADQILAALTDPKTQRNTP